MARSQGTSSPSTQMRRSGEELGSLPCTGGTLSRSGSPDRASAELAPRPRLGNDSVPFLVWLGTRRTGHGLHERCRAADVVAIESTSRILDRALPHAREIALATLVGVLVALSPLTPDDLIPSIGAGLLAGLLFLAYRVYYRKTPDSGEEPALSAPERAAAPAFRLRQVPPLVWAGLLLFVLLFTPTLWWMYGKWTGSVWRNSHGLFMPFLMFFLARAALRRESSGDDTVSAWGFAFLVPGLLLLVLDSAIGTRYLSSLGLVVCLPGLSLLLLGRQRTLALRFVWLLGLFMIPISTSVANHLLLRNASAAGTVTLLQGLGVPVFRDHSVLELANSTFVVSEACSGFATLYSAVAVTCLLVCYCASPLRRAALVMACFPLALASNIVRTLFLVLVAVYGRINLLDTPLHEASGVASFLVIISVLYWMADRRAVRNAFS